MQFLVVSDVLGAMRWSLTNHLENRCPGLLGLPCALGDLRAHYLGLQIVFPRFRVSSRALIILPKRPYRAKRRASCPRLASGLGSACQTSEAFAFPGSSLSSHSAHRCQHDSRVWGCRLYADFIHQPCIKSSCVLALKTIFKL